MRTQEGQTQKAPKKGENLCFEGLESSPGAGAYMYFTEALKEFYLAFFYNKNLNFFQLENFTFLWHTMI
jgi:hypothetical protein